MQKIPMILAALALAGGFCIAAPALAGSVATGAALPFLARPSHVEPAAHKRRISDRSRSGLRDDHRHGPYLYHYRGWWYPRPWWYAPGIAIGLGTSEGDYGGYYDDFGFAEDGYADDSGDEHVQWCLNHHRSYDPGTDSFWGHDGQHPCSSPFD
jgi:hypothetical protein